MFIHFYLVYVRHFLNTILFFGPFWRPLWLSALGSHLVCLMIAPALCVESRLNTQGAKTSSGFVFKMIDSN